MSGGNDGGGGGGRYSSSRRDERGGYPDDVADQPAVFTSYRSQRLQQEQQQRDNMNVDAHAVPYGGGRYSSSHQSQRGGRYDERPDAGAYLSSFDNGRQQGSFRSDRGFGGGRDDDRGFGGGRDDDRRRGDDRRRDDRRDDRGFDRERSPGRRRDDGGRFDGRGSRRNGDPGDRGEQRRGGGGGGGNFAPPPGPSAEESRRQVALQLSAASLEESKEGKVAQRPSFGTNGRAIKVHANFFGLNLDPTKTIYQYRVEISQRATSKLETRSGICHRVFEAWQELAGTYFTQSRHNETHISAARFAAYDGDAMLFTIRPLYMGGDDTLDPADDRESMPSFSVPLGEGDRDVFDIKLNLVATLNFGLIKRFIDGEAMEIPRDLFSAVDIVLKLFPVKQFLTITKKTGTSFFDDRSERSFKGLELKKGWSQSIRPSGGALSLIIDQATTGFYQAGPLSRAVVNFTNARDEDFISPRYFSPGTGEFKRLAKYVKELKVKPTYVRVSRRNKYKVQELAETNAHTTPMEYKAPDGSLVNMSVFNYFRDILNVTLHYPNWPLLSVGSLKNIYFPIEMVEVLPGQRFKGSEEPDTVREILKIANVKPLDRFSFISRGRETLHPNRDTGNAVDTSVPHETEILREWGISLGNEPKVIDARVLPSPRITARREDLIPNNGSFMLRNAFELPGSLAVVGVAIVGQIASRRSVAEFMGRVMTECQKKGMTANSRVDWDRLIVQDDRETIQNLLRMADARAAKYHNARHSDLVFVFLDGDAETYAGVKSAAECEVDILTQCVLAKNANVTPKGLERSLALKINAKMNGVNHRVAVSNVSENAMFVGIDCSHDRSGSIVAFAHSIDVSFIQYRGSYQAQEALKDIITSTATLIQEAVSFYREKNGRNPSQIIIYRDGVSEGQFKVVLNTEVNNIIKFLLDYDPQIQLTVLVVNKRHSARFKPLDRRDGDRNGNLLSGTVIDTDVTHPYEGDFYLNSHAGLQGTSRAAHYHILYDSVGYSADQIQAFTYELTFAYSRTTKAVSVAPPAYFAGLIAKRARSYNTAGFSESASSFSGNSGGRGILSLKPLKERTRDSMFFS